jgi:hypothetical protein
MLKTVQSRQRTQIETLSSQRIKEDFLVTFSMIPIYNVENELIGFLCEDVSRRKREKKEKQLIELTQNNKDLKQFSYIRPII